MSLIQHYGDPKSPIWFIVDKPYPADAEKGTLFSGGYGYNFFKVLRLSGLPADKIHIHSVRPCLGTEYHSPEDRLYLLEQELGNYRPPLVVPLEDWIINYLCPITKQKKDKKKGKYASLWKWAGSLLTSPLIHYEHYVIGSFAPDFITQNWDLHEIQAFIDFGHVKEEYEFYVRNNYLQSLPHRNLIVEPSYATVMDYLSYLLDSYANSKSGNGFGSFKVSTDIETIRPKKNSIYHNLHHPGFPYTLSFAPSSKEAISFSFWDYGDPDKGGSSDKQVKLIRKLEEIFSKIPQIGQNYFSFDSHYMESFGFNMCLQQCSDTLLRHHILWPTLEHKLQFQTRQYTREPYYKDEGKQWSKERKDQLMKYNAKDAAVTYEIWERQEEEFNERPHLR